MKSISNFLVCIVKELVGKPRKHLGSPQTLQPGYAYKPECWKENAVFFLCSISLLGTVGFK